MRTEDVMQFWIPTTQTNNSPCYQKC